MSKLKTKLEVYEETVQKFCSLIEDLKDCLRCGDYERANDSLEDLRRYDRCHYCLNFRLALEGDRNYKGVCGSCPLHQHGQILEDRQLSYNGCYKIGVYRTLVKSAFWFRSDRSYQTLEAVTRDAESSLAYLRKIKDELLYAKM